MNLQRGKTEVVLDLRGVGAKKIREDLNRVKPPTLCISTTTSGDIFITVVAKYKHLVTLFSHKGSMGPEIRSRLGQARADFQRLRKKLFNNHELPERTRIQLFHTLVLTGLMYNIAVWPPLMKRDEDKFACGIQSLYNSLALAIWGEETLSWRYERTMARLSMPDGYTLMRVARLRYLQHLLYKADEFVWACVHLCPAWLNLLDCDFRWLQYHCPQEAPQEDPSNDWRPWQALLSNGRAWVKLVKKAQKHCELQTKKNIDWETWHRDALMILKDHKLWRDAKEVKLDGAHACLLCKQRFRTKAAWSVHAFRSHGRIAPHRRYAEGAHCVICRKVFQYHSALVNHIRYSDRCRQELQRRDMVASVEPSIGSTQERAIRDNAIAPIMRSFGPNLPDVPLGRVVLEGSLSNSEQCFVEEVVDLLEAYVGELWPTEVFVGYVWDALQRSTVYPGDLLQLLQRCLARYREGLDLDDVEDHNIDHGLADLSEEMERRWSTEWLMGHIPTTKESTITGRGDLDPVAEFQKLVDQGVRGCFKPRPLRIKAIIMLHLFSGHRRPGDVQEEFERLQSTSKFGPTTSRNGHPEVAGTGASHCGQ